MKMGRAHSWPSLGLGILTTGLLLSLLWAASRSGSRQRPVSMVAYWARVASSIISADPRSSCPGISRPPRR
jgi:hypothetical protein